jgi:aminobenzoyl-glutamate transport protein
MTFLIAGVGYGRGAGTFTGPNDVIAAVTKMFASLAGLVFMLLMIAQFIAYFNYSNIPSVLAITLAEVLETAGIGALPLLIGMILVIFLLDVIMPGLVPKWAIFAPIFVPLLMRLNVDPEAVLAAYRVGDSPINSVSPLNAYFALIVSFARVYQKDAGVGTVIALMLPYVVALFIAWPILLAVWHLLGLPWGL